MRLFSCEDLTQELAYLAVLFPFVGWIEIERFSWQVGSLYSKEG